MPEVQIGMADYLLLQDISLHHKPVFLRELWGLPLSLKTVMRSAKKLCRAGLAQEIKGDRATSTHSFQITKSGRVFLRKLQTALKNKRTRLPVIYTMSD